MECHLSGNTGRTRGKLHSVSDHKKAPSKGAIFFQGGILYSEAFFEETVSFLETVSKGLDSLSYSFFFTFFFLGSLGFRFW